MGNSHADTNITITATAGDARASVPATGERVYSLKLEGYTEDDDITVTMSGTQYLPIGVYFYEPYAAEGQDVRKVSQNLVGLNAGTVPVGDTVTLDGAKLASASLGLKKVNETGVALSGAEFELAYVGEEDITTVLGTYTTNANGEAIIDGLMAGKTYQLTETKAPAGYDPITGEIEFTVEQNEDLSLDMVFNLPNGVTCNTPEDEQYILTVVNCETPSGGGGNGGGGGGGTVIIPEDPTPLTPAPEPEELPEEPVPLVPAPELEEIPEEEVPLAAVPMTGDAAALWLALSALSGTGLAGVSLLGRKKRED